MGNFQRGNHYFETKNLENAKKEYEDALKLNPNSKDIIFNLGLTYFNLKDYKKASKNFQEVIKLSSKEEQEDHEAYSHLGKCKMIEKKYVEAKSDFSIALKINPKYGEAFYNRAICEYYFKNYPQCVKDLTSCLEIDPNNYVVLINRGIVLCEMKKYEDSLNDFIEVTKIPDVDLSRVNYCRGLCYYHRNEYDFAILDFKEVIERVENQKDSPFSKFRILSYFYIGNSFFHLSLDDSNIQYHRQFVFIEDAIKNFSKALELERNPYYYLMRGNCFLRLARLESKNVDVSNIKKAILNYKEAINMNNHVLEAHSNLGTCYRLLSQHEKAIEKFSFTIDYSRRVLDNFSVKDIESIQNKLEFAFYYRGISKYKVGKYFESINDLTNALSNQKFKKDYIPYFYRGLSFRKLKKYEKAKVDFLECVKYQKEGLSKTYQCLGELFFIIGDYSKAKDYYCLSIKSKSLCPDVLYNCLGFVFEKINSLSNSVKCYTKSIEGEISNPICRFTCFCNRSIVFLKLNNKEKAFSDYLFCKKKKDILNKSEINEEIRRRFLFLEEHFSKSDDNQKITNDLYLL